MYAMKFQCLYSAILLITLSGCQNSENKKALDNLNFIKEDFIFSIFEENVDESPFHINYAFRTVFFSKELISCFGAINVYDHLPHGWGCYEGKTFCKINGRFKQITLNDLFTTPKQKEFLRSYCEDSLKNTNKQSGCTYFSGEDPLYTSLDYNRIRTFVIDDQFLIIIFQPYSVGGYGDGPFFVKIPYDILSDQWDPANPLISALSNAIASQAYSSSWEEESGFYAMPE